MSLTEKIDLYNVEYEVDNIHGMYYMAGDIIIVESRKITRLWRVNKGKFGKFSGEKKRVLYLCYYEFLEKLPEDIVKKIMFYYLDSLNLDNENFYLKSSLLSNYVTNE